MCFAIYINWTFAQINSIEFASLCLQDIRFLVLQTTANQASEQSGGWSTQARLTLTIGVRRMNSTSNSVLFQNPYDVKYAESRKYLKCNFMLFFVVSVELIYLYIHAILSEANCCI